MPAWNAMNALSALFHCAVLPIIYCHNLVGSLLLDHASCTQPQHQSYLVALQARGGFAPPLCHVLNYEEENAASKQPLDASSNSAFANNIAGIAAVSTFSA